MFVGDILLCYFLFCYFVVVFVIVIVIVIVSCHRHRHFVITGFRDNEVFAQRSSLITFTLSSASFIFSSLAQREMRM